MTFTESNTVEAHLVARLRAMSPSASLPDQAHSPSFNPSGKGLGWYAMDAATLGRQPQEVLVEAQLRGALVALNTCIAKQPERADEVLYRLRAIIMTVRETGLVKANEEFAAWLLGERSMPFGDDGEHVTIHLIDFEDLSRNQYVVTQQFTIRAGKTEKRADVVLLVNGMPLVVIEAKTPVRSSQSWLDAAIQLHEDYERNVPELFVPNVFSVATEGKEFRYGSVGMPLDLWGPWRLAEESGPASLGQVEKAIDSMLRPNRVLHRDEVVCMIALKSNANRVYDEMDLQLAMGIASIAAPQLVAAKHAEQLLRENVRLRENIPIEEELVGMASAMVDLRDRIQQVARTDLNVLILGETGVGKEIAAGLIHRLSPRAKGPFVVVNCAAIPSDLFESEFFGHESGAFTGASRRRIGYMEQANGGILFLDEIGDLSQENQARILRAIETGTFRTVGGEALHHASVRFIAATNRNLQTTGFRTDLLHRLDGVTIHIPPLRDRVQDIPLLLKHFTQRLFDPADDSNSTHFDESAMTFLAELPWPGNVRELRNLILRAIALKNDGMIDAQLLASLTKSVAKTYTEIDVGVAKVNTFSPATLADVEREHILKTLDTCGGNIAATARSLGINRVTLYKKLASIKSSETPS